MAIGRLLRTVDSSQTSKKLTVGMSMFGVAPPCVNAVKVEWRKNVMRHLVLVGRLWKIF